MQSERSITKKAMLLACFLTVTCLTGILLFFFGQKEPGQIADIYQDGILLYSIPLDEVTESYTLPIYGENNCFNEILISPGEISICSASCPDKLCMHQGILSGKGLPIICLPNRLVIQLRSRKSHPDSAPDAVTY